MQEGQAEAELEELARSTLERNNGDAEAAAAELGSKLLLHEKSKTWQKFLILLWSMLRKYWKNQDWTRLLPLSCSRQALEETVNRGGIIPGSPSVLNLRY